MSETPCPFCGQIHGTACTPANPTDQIATTPAVLSPETPIVPTSGTKRVSDDSEAAVAHDAQQYDWREDWNRVQTRIGYDEDAHVDAMHRLAAHIERLEAERDALRDKCESGHWLSDDEWYAGERANADFLIRYHALLAEHEVGRAYHYNNHPLFRKAWKVSHNNAERVIRG